MKNRIVVVYSSHLTEAVDAEFETHIYNTCGVDVDIHRYQNNNQYSLPEVYNKAIDEVDMTDAVTVFCHNDILFDTKNWGVKLLQHFNSKRNNYQIIGVAGTNELNSHGCWWLKEDGKTMNFSNMVGIVNHLDEIRNKKWESRYSEPHVGVKSVLTIDGLFMAVDVKNIENRFDEEYKGFHYYDLSFCIPNYLDGCNIGVITDIRITHKSVGQTNEQWEKNRIQFINKYEEFLPLNIKDLTIVDEGKLNILITCMSFANLTGSEMYVFELSKNLRKLGHSVTVIAQNIGNPLLNKANKLDVRVRQLSNYPKDKFDIIHINHKPIGEQILNVYRNTPCVMHIHSEIIPVFEEPIIHSNIKKYFSIRDSVREYIKSYGISDDQIVDVVNPIDPDRFNTKYNKKENDKEIVLFVGTLDYLRKNMLFDLKQQTKENNQLLWIIGANNGGYVNELIDDHVKYYGVVNDVEKYVKKCDYTAGIMLGRTTLEGYMCGKKGWIYDVDNKGNIKSSILTDIPENINDYRSDVVAKKISEIYYNVI